MAKIDDSNINKKTALVKHVVKFQHSIDFDNSSIPAFKSDFFKCHFLKSFFINNKIYHLDLIQFFQFNSIQSTHSTI